MKKERGIAIENSFTLKLVNTTNTTQRVSLFEQGGGGINQAIEVNAGLEAAFGGNLVLNPLIWNFAGQQPFYYNASPNVTSPFDVNLWSSQGGGNLRISVTTGSFVDVPIAPNETITQVNARIQNTIETTSDPSNFMSPSGKFTQIRIFFDENYFSQYLNSLPLPIISPSVTGAWGVSIEYPTDSVNIWADMNFPLNPLTKDFVQGSVPMSLSRTASANGVLVNETQGVSYEEILRSQTGNAYDVISMGLDLGVSPNQDTRDSQMLSTFCFTKNSINGNELSYCKAPTKDPYQFQNSYGVIDMATQSDNYVLDGQTKFAYDVQSQTTVFLTYNYARITNLVFDTEYGLAKAVAEQEKIARYDERRNVNRVITLKIPKKKVAEKTNKFSNFTNNAFKGNNNLKKAFIGIGAIFVFYKLNQTKLL